MRLWLTSVVLLSGVAFAPPVDAADTDKLAFNRDIRPILSDNCFRCHGFDKNTREADLRLDTAEGAYADRDGVKPIIPGKPDESELVRRISSEDPDERMPPPASHQSLTPAQIDTIRRWISQGAEYQPHWAFIAPVEPAVPKIDDSKCTVRNPIDAFIASRLKQENLSMSSEADRATLLRRVTLDLTGLPPTPEELDAFIADTSTDAYEKAVDRLLASPRYGERMVIEWLDAARYADTNGYQGDRTRTMWPWRDWVVRALNENMPFDQFTVNQIAGDLLPDATFEQKLATAFNRNHPLNGEGGRIPEESRVDYVMDRAETVGTVWLGLTVGCCRCHDHKYDPLAQKEYYRLFAYFNNVAETGAVDISGSGNANPVVRMVLPENEPKLAELRTTVEEAEAKLNDSLPAVDAAQAEWERNQISTPEWSLPKVLSITGKSDGSIDILDDSSLLARATAANTTETEVYDVVLHTQQTGMTALRFEAIRHESLPEGGPGRAPSGNFVLTAIEGEARSLADSKQKQKIRFSAAHADYAQPGFGPEGVIDGNKRSGWAVLDPPNENPRIGIFELSEPVGFAEGTELHLRFRFESEHAQHSAGHFRLSFTSHSQPGLSLMPEDVAAALAQPPEQRTDAVREKIRDFYREHLWPDYRNLTAATATARNALSDYEQSLPHVMVMEDLPTPRESFILDKGIYTKPGEKVEPGVFASLHSADKEMPKTRLDFARWLVDPSHPLVARVAVNRYWQLFFGTGIVKTAEDFGVQGESPSHPELLDWLASQFVKSGWDVKAMHRLIVTSAAYRQSSRTTPELLERDPANRLIARGPRHRLSAFTIRDQALAVSGLLIDRLGGPPVKPYMAAGVWEDASIGQIKYKRDKGEGLYRRSVYTFWRRIAAPAMLFDTSARSVCAVRLPRTNTPLQALILMNDVQYVEAARNLGMQIMKSSATTPADRIAIAFRLCTSRLPKEAEQQLLVEAYEKLLSRYQSDSAAAEELTTQGDSRRPADLNVAELAAYTGVSSLILNLDETVTKE